MQNKRIRDLTGQTFGFLTAIDLVPNHNGSAIWRWRCKCGNIIERKGIAVTTNRNHSANCGCMPSYLFKKTLTTHGMSKHPAYRVWCGMRERCKNKNHKGYHNYGGRGIKVCAHWMEFSNFWADMGTKYSKGLTLDRIDGDKDYAKSNCRWVTPKQQAYNTRSNVRIHTSKGYITITEAAEFFNISRTTIRSRMWAGCPEKYLTVPVEEYLECRK